MLLNRPVLIWHMRFVGHSLSINHDAHGALTGTQRHHNALRGTNRHEPGRCDELDRKDKHRQYGQQTPRKSRLSDHPRHGTPLSRPRPPCHQAKLTQITLDVNVNLS